MISREYSITIDTEKLADQMMAKYQDIDDSFSFETSLKVQDLDYMAMKLGYCTFYSAMEAAERETHAENTLVWNQACKAMVNLTEEDIQRAFIQSNKELE